MAPLALLPLAAAFAQDVPAVPLAPVPAALRSAKTVFISNAGADSGLFPHPFTGDPDRAYNEFYAAIEGWGKYKAVTAPAYADLVYELQLTAAAYPVRP